MTENKAVYKRVVASATSAGLVSLPRRRVVRRTSVHSANFRAPSRPDERAARRGKPVYAKAEYETEYEGEKPALKPEVIQAEIFDENTESNNTSLTTLEEESEPLDIASAADIAVGQTEARDEVSELVHSEAKYTELPTPKDKKSVAKDADVKVQFEKSPEADFVVDAYEVLDSETVVDNISNVVIPEPEVEIPQMGEESGEAVDTDLDVLKERESSLTVKQVLAFSIPALAGIMTDPLMSFVDTACVGKMSTTELAAMGPNTAIYNFVLQIFTCFIVYTCGQVSKLSSKGQHEEVFKLTSHALFLGVAVGTTVAAGLIGFSNPLLASMDTLPELMAPAASYLKIRALSLPAVLVCMVSGAFCLGRKDSKTPLLVAIASTITNLLGDIILIFGPAKMGISGAAIATTASVYVGAMYFIWKVSNQIPLRFRVPTWQDIKPFITTSSMLTIRNCSIMFNYIAMTMFVGTYGTVATASHQVAISVFMIGNLAAEPFSQCAQSFLASIGSLKKRSLGEHKYLIGAMKLLAVSTFVCGAAMALMTITLCNIPALFTADAVIASKVGKVAPLVALAVWLSCVNCVTDGFTFAALDYKFSATVAVANVPILLSLLTLMGKVYGGMASVWLGMMAFYAIRLTQNVVRVTFLNNKRLDKSECTKVKSV